VKKEIAERWIEALKSGKYEQGKMYLRRWGQYCCLGVLCDLAVADGIGEWKIGHSWYPVGFEIGRITEYHYLPRAVAQWAGIKNELAPIDLKWLSVQDQQRFRNRLDLSLAVLNDEGYDFKRIAKLIARRWESL